jgi:hypothetical protein
MTASAARARVTLCERARAALVASPPVVANPEVAKIIPENIPEPRETAVSCPVAAPPWRAIP